MPPGPRSTSPGPARTKPRPPACAAGYRVFGDVSLGLEGGVNANDLGEDARVGLFARYAWNGGEFSLSGGFSGRFLEEAQSLEDPYATANLLTQF